MNINNTISVYRQFIEWTDTLQELDNTIWFKPIKDGKASIAEIISHLMNWDRFLISDIIPKITNGNGIVFPEFDSFNSLAYQYAKSGVSKNQLLREFSSARLELTDILEKLDPEHLVRNVTANGATHCPHTGTAYSLLYIIHEFIDHDDHHKEQV
jgi:hypothetical protein